MVSKVVKVVNAEGLHMRPAGIIAKAAKEHPECEIMMKATGENEQAVLDEFVKMFEDGFGE